MNAESILIYAIYIMVLTHIDAVVIMVSITTPNEVVPPQILIASIEIRKESIATKVCRREVQASFCQVTRHYGTGIIIHIFLDEIQHVPGFEKAVDSLFIKKNPSVHVPVQQLS